MKFNYKIFILFILLSMVNVFSESDLEYCNINLMGEALPLIAIGLIISILFVSLFYMYGKLLSNSEVEGTYMVELQQIGLTIVMILLITGGIEILCNVSFNSEGLVFGESNVFSSVKATQLNLMKKTMDFYIGLMDLVNFYSILGSAQAGYGSITYNISFSPAPGGNFIAQTMAPIGQTVLIAYFAQAFQYALLEFSRSKIFLLLLPIGLVLRSFPITRKFGGVLVALVLGLSYLYPLFLNLGYILVDVNSIEMLPQRKGVIPLLYGISAQMMGLSFLTSGDKGKQASFWMLAVIGTIYSAGSIGEMFDSEAQFKVLGVLSLTGDFFFKMFDKMYHSLGTIMLATFFIPAFIIIVLAAVVRSLSASIGTETDISGILRAV